MNMENNIVLYQHIRLDTNEVFYIGIGNEKRPYIKTGRNKLWHKVVKKAGYRIEIISKNMSLKEAFMCEKYLISFYGRKNNTHWGTLVNMTDGGEGSTGSKHSQETRKKISEAGKNGIFTDERRKKISEALKGNKNGLGFTHSEETKRKIGEANKGNTNNLGKTFTDEHRKKISEALKGKSFTDERRKKLSEKTKLYWENRKNLQQDK